MDDRRLEKILEAVHGRDINLRALKSLPGSGPPTVKVNNVLQCDERSGGRPGRGIPARNAICAAIKGQAAGLGVQGWACRASGVGPSGGLGRQPPAKRRPKKQSSINCHRESGLRALKSLLASGAPVTNGVGASKPSPIRHDLTLEVNA